MENNLITLLKIESMNRFGTNQYKYEKDKKKRHNALGIKLGIAAVSIVLAIYCFLIAYFFGYMNISYLIPGYALTISSLITLFFTLLKTNGVLFASRDYDMLMAFPIKVETVITAKFLSMYLNNLIFSVVVMASMAVGYACFNTVTLVGVLAWTLTILISPLLPMTIAAILGSLIARVGSGFKHKTFVQMLLSILLFAGVIGLSFWAQNNAKKDEAVFLNKLADLGSSISKILHKTYPLSAWFDKAVNNENIVALVALIGVSVIVYGVFVWAVSKSYRKINTALQSHHTTSNYKVGELKKNSLIMALVKKEAKRFFSSVNYMMNNGIGLIFALILSIVSIFTGVDKALNAMEIQNIDSFKPMISGLIPFVLAMLINMSNTSSVSLSLEGRNLWVVQSLPIERKTLLHGKMLFNIMIVLPVSLICNIIFMFVLRVNVIMALLYIVFAVASVVFSTIWGTYMNVHFPNYTWQNELEVIKQGMSSMITIFSSLIGYLLMAVAAVLLKDIMAIEVIILGFSVILLCGGYGLYRMCID